MTLCMHMCNILQFGRWLNFAKEHVEYNNRYKITNVDYYGELTHKSRIFSSLLRIIYSSGQQLIFFYFGFYLHH